MLKIQVLGKGLIPRGMGLAPKKTPFPADLNLIRTILSSPGLKVNFINPKTGALSPITRDNCQRVWDMFNSRNGTALNAEVKSDAPTSTPNDVPAVTPPVNQTPAAPVVTPQATPAPAPQTAPVVNQPAEVKPPVITPSTNSAAAPATSNNTPAAPANTTPEKPAEAEKPAEPAKPADNSGMLKPVNRPDDKDSKPNQSQNNDNSKK